MISYPPCKINIGLHILRKRPDKFHEIESIMQEIPLTDILEVIAAPDQKLHFSSSGLDIPGNPESNLVLKAWQLMHQKFQIGPVHIHLHKRIPMGAGLGGGSSDAAFALKMLNDLFDCRLDTSKLEALAAELGSDCAFFIAGGTALATGRGEKIMPLPEVNEGYYMQLLKPDIHIPTAEAYAGIKCYENRKSLRKTWPQEISDWHKFFSNDFEKQLFQKYTGLKKIKDYFYEKGAVYAAMSGSGSAIYGIFNTTPPPLPAKFSFEWEGFISQKIPTLRP